MSRIINFTKMHTLGNDFVVINAMTQPLDIEPEWVKAIGNRHRGIGFDQLLIIRQSESGDYDAELEIYNSDGSSAEQCGNGAMCVARYLQEENLVGSDEMVVKTMRSFFYALVDDATDDGIDKVVLVGFTDPTFVPELIPFRATKDALSYTLPLDDTTGATVEVTPVGMGNPHAVVFDPPEGYSKEEVAKVIQSNKRFPNSTNVEFVSVLSDSEMTVRVFERGAGETFACGTGACASVAAARMHGLVKPFVMVGQLGGFTSVRYDLSESYGIALTAETNRVYEGELVVD